MLFSLFWPLTFALQSPDANNQSIFPQYAQSASWLLLGVLFYPLVIAIGFLVVLLTVNIFSQFIFATDFKEVAKFVPLFEPIAGAIFKYFIFIFVYVSILFFYGNYIAEYVNTFALSGIKTEQYFDASRQIEDIKTQSESLKDKVVNTVQGNVRLPALKKKRK
jgi:hypothetical protein